MVDVLKKIGEILGYECIKEFKVQKGRIDLVWKKDNQLIAFEIEANNSKSQQIINLIKVLDFKPTIYIPIYYKPPTITKELKNLSNTYPITISSKFVNKENVCIEIIKELNNDLSLKDKERVSIFIEKTGLSRRSYYRYKKMLNEYENK